MLNLAVTPVDRAVGAIERGVLSVSRCHFFGDDAVFIFLKHHF